MAQTVKPRGGKQLRLALLLSTSGIGLLAAGFTAPLLGVIDGSVLVTYDEVMIPVGVLLGLDYKYKYHEEL